MSAAIQTCAESARVVIIEKMSVTGIINVHNKSIITSGSYERDFELNGCCYHHISDPVTGYPPDNELLSATIVSANALDGDNLTVLIYGMG
ncbi:FAD:protein FMN transferase [Enterobacteriaceae bacterium LUAb1]